MAARTTAPDAGDAHRHGQHGVAVYSMLTSPAAHIKTNQTSDWVDALGAVGADVHAKLGGTYVDGSFTVKLQGANTPDDSDDWRDIGTASGAGAAAEAKISSSVLHGGSSTSAIGYGVNLPRYLRCVLVAGGAPATGSYVDYMQLVVRY